MDYALVYVTLRNYRTHDKVDLQFDGKSYILVGDTGQGKSSILEAIKVAHKYTSFPKDALKQGKQEGALEIGIIVKDEPYKVICDFDESGNGRWRVKANGKGSYSLEEVLRELFVGLARKGMNGAYFDYGQYFYVEKSPVARFKYLMSCILGSAYDETEKKIMQLEKDRGMIGSKRSLIQARLHNAEITDDNYEELAEKYKEKKTNEQAQAKRDKELEEKLVDLKDLEEKQAKVKRDNLSFKQRLEKIKEKKKQEEQITEQITLLQRQLEDVNKEVKELEVTNKKFPQDIQKEADLLQQLEVAEQNNTKLRNTIEMEYEAERTENETFNLQQAAFERDQKDFLDAQVLSIEWNSLDANIKEIRQSNIEEFKKVLDISDLEIKEIEKKDKEGEIKKEQHVYYKGRELNIDNISKGESIQIATKIQEGLNPAGFRLILLPEAQSLGSSLPEIVKEAHLQGYQIVAEFTEPHRELEAVILEDFIEEKDTESKLLEESRKLRKSNGKKITGENGDKKDTESKLLEESRKLRKSNGKKITGENGDKKE